MLSSPSYHFLEDGFAGSCHSGDRGLRGAGSLADRLGGCVLGVGCGEGLLSEAVEGDATRLALLRGLAVGDGTAGEGKVHGVEPGDVTYTITPCSREGGGESGERGEERGE